MFAQMPNWLSTLLPSIPAILVLLAGVIVLLVAYIGGRRRTASCLGAIAFAVLLVLNVLSAEAPVVILRLVGQGYSAGQASNIWGIASLCLGLVDALAIAMLIAAVVIEERKPAGGDHQ